MADQTAAQSSGFDTRGILVNVLLNAAIPLVLYSLVKRYVSDSDAIALGVAAVFPLGTNAAELLRARRLNIIGILALLGILVSLAALLLGGDPRVLLIRESFLTGALGIACFVSLLLPRPLMFYFGREFQGRDPARLAQYDATYQIPAGRRVHRLITIVWGGAFTGEFTLRVIMVYTLPTAVVLGISPIIFGAVTIATLTWTFSYVRAAQRRGRARLGATPGTDPS
jgi:hypothetical protein